MKRKLKLDDLTVRSFVTRKEMDSCGILGAGRPAPRDSEAVCSVIVACATWICGETEPFCIPLD